LNNNTTTTTATVTGFAEGMFLFFNPCDDPVPNGRRGDGLTLQWTSQSRKKGKIPKYNKKKNWRKNVKCVWEMGLGFRETE